MRLDVVNLQVEENALRALLAQADHGQLTSQDLAAYPAFTHGSTIAPFATQLSDLEVQRTRLLERRTEKDPEVLAIDRSIQLVSASIATMARTYLNSTAQQRREYQTRLDSLDRTLSSLPAANERVGRLQRDVLGFTALSTALEAQLVEARLGAIGEGGNVRQIDVAEQPRMPSFPQPFITLGIGTGGGLIIGFVAALFMNWFGRWLRDPLEIERLTGIAAERFHADAPLLVAGSGTKRTVLVIPLDPRAESRGVAERLARTAAARVSSVHIIDLTADGLAGNGNGHPGVDAARKIDGLEAQGGNVIVQLPSLWSETTLAALRENRPVVLVAPPGPVDRNQLTTALDTLRRMQIPCAGIVISESTRPRVRALI
jgi:tyrosine-protein kinase Etk/Wzc